MTASPRASHGPAAALDPRYVVLHQITGAQRRLRIELAVNYAAHATAIALVGAALALRALPPVDVFSAVWLPVALALGLAAAFAAAWRRGPSLAASAAILDRRLALHDQASAALQLMPSTSPVAELVLRDAAARLAPLRLASAFPVRVRRRTMGLLAASVAVLTGVLLVSPEAQAPAVGSGVMSTGGAATSSGDTGGRARTPDQPQGAPAATTTAAATSTAANARPPVRTNAGAENRASAAAIDAGPQAAPGTTADMQSRREATSAAFADGARSMSNPGAAGAAGSAAGARPASASPPPSAGVAPAGAQSSASATGAARTSPAASGRGAGGVGSAALADASRRASPGTPVPAAALLTASSTGTITEAVMTQNDVPPAHRVFVREYFRAIQGTPQP